MLSIDVATGIFSVFVGKVDDSPHFDFCSFYLRPMTASCAAAVYCGALGKPSIADIVMRFPQVAKNSGGH